MLIIQHNLAAINAQRQFNIVSDQKTKSMRKLSSGYRINSAADDAAGLAISEKMRRQIRGLKQGTENLQDGVSLCQVADGALNEVEDMLQRMNELSVKAANDTNEETDRGYIDTEVQQIKEETNRILGTTSFNEKYIFRQPYYPTVTGTPDDFQVYNSGSGTYAGIIVGNTRYSQDELKTLGMQYNPDGTFADNDVTFTHKNELTGVSEKVHLTTEDGAALNDIHRVYDWSADTDGIYINGAMAEKWTDLGITGDSISGGSEYSFTYHGMVISFTTEDGDSRLSDAINGINGDGMSTVSWQTASPYTASEAAVNYDSVTLPTPEEIKTDANAVIVDEHSATPYGLKATATGISVYNKDTGSVIGSETAWADLTTDSTSPAYKINDWGLSETTNAATLDHDEVYTYTGKLDTGSSFSVSFQIMDEASRAAVIDSLNTFTIYSGVSAPLTAKLSDGNGASVSFGFDFQVKSGRDFTKGTDASGNDEQCYSDIAVDNSNLKVTKTKDADGNDQYTASGYITCKVGEYTFQSASLDGSVIYSSGNTKLKDLKLTCKNADGTERAGITLDSYDFTKSLNLQIYANGYAKRTMTASDSSGTENATFYNIEMNSVNKSLKLQASANEEDRYNLVWKAMNTTTLGIAAAGTKTRAGAVNTIDLVKNALNEVSTERSLFGSWQNRIEHGMNQNRNVEENTQAAESAIRDTDMAGEMVRLSNQQILEQAGYSVMAQANQSRQGVLTILQSG